MAQQIIGIGAAPNDGSGDLIRDAFDKVNDNFTELYADKAPLASPALTGVPTAPTAATPTNTTQLATTAFVQAVVAALVDSSPAALDTLNELAAALGDDANFAATMTAALAGKQPLDADLTAIAALATTAFGRSLLTQADAAAVRTLLDVSTSGERLLATFTGDGSTGTCTFASIPATYTDLIVRATLRASGAGLANNAVVTVNAIGAGAYDSNRAGGLAGAFSGAELLAAANWAQVFVGIPGSDATAGFVTGGEIQLLNYQSAMHKLMLWRARRMSHLTSGAGYAYDGNAIVRTTDVINSLTIALGAGNFVAGTRIDLYGRR